MGSQTLSRGGAGLGSGGGRGAPRPLTGPSSTPPSRRWLRKGLAPQRPPMPTLRQTQGSWSRSVHDDGTLDAMDGPGTNAALQMEVDQSSGLPGATNLKTQNIHMEIE